VSQALRIIGIVIGLGVGALVLDYGSYFQSVIFTTLDGSDKGFDDEIRSPPYHPFPHPILWLLIAIILVPTFLMIAFNVAGDLSAWVVAIGVSSFLLARYMLMRKGIS
jgi:hypothetical protein